MTKKLGGTFVTADRPPTYEKRTTSEKEVVLVAPAPLGAAGEPNAENRGTAPRVKRPFYNAPLDQGKIEQATQMLRGGMKQAAVARAIGISEASVSRIAIGRRTDVKGPRLTENRKRKLVLEDARAMRRLFRDGTSMTAIRRMYGVGLETVRDVVFDRFLPEPPQPPRRFGLTGDEARSLYLTEKAKRAGRPDPRFQEAREALERLNALNAEIGKGGRPRGKNTIQLERSRFTQHDATDLTQYLSPYFGRSA